MLLSSCQLRAAIWQRSILFPTESRAFCQLHSASQAGLIASRPSQAWYWSLCHMLGLQQFLKLMRHVCKRPVVSGHGHHQQASACRPSLVDCTRVASEFAGSLATNQRSRWCYRLLLAGTHVMGGGLQARTLRRLAKESTLCRAHTSARSKF